MGTLVWCTPRTLILLWQRAHSVSARCMFVRAFRVTIREREFTFLFCCSVPVPVCITIYGIRECRRSPAGCLLSAQRTCNHYNGNQRNDDSSPAFPIGSFLLARIFLLARSIDYDITNFSIGSLVHACHRLVCY